ncbi:MAG: ribosome maturation factor RimM [Eubacteriales bacterium]|jgi:16S rRNA processing protein RimM
MGNERKQFLEAGMITTTHGVRGAVRIQPWTDTPDVLCDIERFYIDGKEVKVISASVHKSVIICVLDGVDDINAAISLRGKTIYINRDDVEVEEGRYFIQDLIGLRVIDSNLGDIGTITDVLTLPANDVYVVQGDKKYMIPAVSEFIKNVDIDAGKAEVELIEGMEA